MGRKSRLKKERVRLPAVLAPAANSPFLKIALTFAALVVAFQLVPGLLLDLTFLQLLVAESVAKILAFSGLPVTVQGFEIFMPKAHWVVIADCTALSAIIMFFAFVLAFPSSKKAKALAAVAGIPFLFLVNILRLVVLAWVTEWNPKVAGYFHDFLWQVGFLLLVITMWLIWIEMVVKRENKAAVPV